MAKELVRSLTFTDLLSFGIASIMGSGGFNLIGDGVLNGGSWFPAAIAIVTALFQGASKVYEEAYKAFKSNTSESDIVREQFGLGAEIGTAFSILLFNVFSISTILVFAAKTVFPKGLWSAQTAAALLISFGMAAFSLLGIEANKEAVAAFSGAVVLILVLASSIGLWEGFRPGGTPPDAWPSALNKTSDFGQSILYFYFILAGFDLLMKFVQESKNPDEDIPKSFYVSNGVSTLLTAGVAYAFVHALTLKKGGAAASKDNAVGLIFDSFFGPPAGSIVHWISIGLMLATAFVTFLGTSRYLYGIGEDYNGGKYKELAFNGVGEWLTRLSDTKVPVNAILLVAGLVALGILVNHTPHLVRLSDFFLTLVLFSVSAAVTKRRFGAGELPLIEGATMIGFMALLGTCCF
jgi:hypothetical protein